MNTVVKNIKKREYPYNLYFDVIREETYMDRSVLLKNIDSVMSLFFTEKEQSIIIMYYSEKLTYSDIGVILGVTKQRIQQVISYSRIRMRTFVCEYILRMGITAYRRRKKSDNEGIETLLLSNSLYSKLMQNDYDTVGKVKYLLSVKETSIMTDQPDLFAFCMDIGVKGFEELEAKLKSRKKGMIAKGGRLLPA